MTKTVDKKSIIFHFDRQDFVRWAKETLGDPKLAKRINNIKKTKSEERLRTQIYKVSKKRLKELNNKHRKKRHAKPLKR
jgi:ssRNA-specific RNase YbeY (16S rRNA maturation enzyme)